MSDTTRHTVDPKFVIPRQGKQMVLYVGLLDAAHRAGMVSMDTEILQYPSKENDQTCIVRAVATFPHIIEMHDIAGGKQEAEVTSTRSYSGIGDANPKNVGGTIVPHFIRMAETRAKARALRDALNVGMVTVEELGGPEEDDDGNSAAKPAPRATSTSGTSATPLNVTPARPASQQHRGVDPHDPRASQKIPDGPMPTMAELREQHARPASPAAPASAQEHPLLATIRDDTADPKKRRTALHNFYMTATTIQELRACDDLAEGAGMPQSDLRAAYNWHVDRIQGKQAAAPAPAATPPAGHAG